MSRYINPRRGVNIHPHLYMPLHICMIKALSLHTVELQLATWKQQCRAVTHRSSGIYIINPTLTYIYIYVSIYLGLFVSLRMLCSWRSHPWAEGMARLHKICSNNIIPLFKQAIPYSSTSPKVHDAATACPFGSLQANRESLRFRVRAAMLWAQKWV